LRYGVDLVKKILCSFLVSLSFFSFNLSAQIATDDIGSENIQFTGDAAGYPFRAKIAGDWVDETKIHRHHDFFNLTFAAAAVDASMIFYYDPCNKEGANLAVAYKKTYLNWQHNPYFNETNFDTISAIVGGYSERLCDWIWRGQLSINFDNIEHWDYQDYMNYDLLLWGRYAFCENIGVHIGIFGQTGMRIDRVYPVIGFDWKYNDNIQINLIYPLNVSAVYSFNPQWSVALAGRFFDERHRVKKDAHLSEGLWVYRVVGGECALNYNPTNWISANIHVGSTIGGTLKVANRNYHNRRRYTVDDSFYAGGELSVSF
jgi:hypothetical protein